MELQPAAGCCWSLSRSPVGDSSQPVPACSPPQAQAPVWATSANQPRPGAWQLQIRAAHVVTRGLARARTLWGNVLGPGACQVTITDSDWQQLPSGWTQSSKTQNNCLLVVSREKLYYGHGPGRAHTATILHHSSCLPVFSGPAGGTGRGGARAKCQVAIVQTKQNVISTLKCDDNERPRESAAIFSYQPSSPLPGPSRAGNGPSRRILLGPRAH